MELLTPKLKESTWFFKDLLSMTVVKKDKDSVYLRGWGEFYVPYSLKLTESPHPGLGHVAWRAESAADLQQAAEIAKKNKMSPEWLDGEYGHGKALRFKSSDGHVSEIIWEMDRYVAPEGLKSKIPSRSFRMPNGGIPVRSLDHCTIFASDVKAVRESYQLMDFKYNEGTYSSAAGFEISAFLTVNSQNHDLGVIRDRTGTKGRLNHIAYYVDNLGMWTSAGDLLAEHGIFIEMGPLKHGITDSFGLYVIEPGGNRVELFNGGYVNYVPKADWKPIVTDVAKLDGYWIPWGLGHMVETWQTYGTPVVKVSDDIKREVLKTLQKQDPYNPTLSGVLAAADLT